MFPPELVELILYYAWGCISTSSHQHGLSMTRWMLVSHDWLKIVLPIVFPDLWITSVAHLDYILRICNSDTSFVCELVGIMDIRQHLAQTCRSLTISAYHKFQAEYVDLCAELVEYATTDSIRNSYRRLLSNDTSDSKLHKYAIPTQSIAAFIKYHTPNVIALHFVLIDCTTIYSTWDTYLPPFEQHFLRIEFPVSLTELHVTFAYTSESPPALLIDAPRGTFFPPPSIFDWPIQCRFHYVQKLVVRDANADFVAFLATACPQLQKIESTAEFGREDVPKKVPRHVQDRLVFVRLPRSLKWGLTGSTDALPLHKPDPPPVWRWRFLECVQHVVWARITFIRQRLFAKRVAKAQKKA